jgi:signal transduction histidine kinase
LSDVAAPAGGARIPSLRRRLSRFVLMLALTWVLATTVALSLWLRLEVNDLLDDGLVATSEALAVVLQSEAMPQGDLPQGGGPGAGSEDDLPFAWQLVDTGGRILMRSANAPTERLVANLADGMAHATNGTGSWRVRARRLGSDRWLLVGQRASERLEATLELAGGTIAAALLVSLAGLGWLRWRLARETQPLADLGAVLARYDPLQAASVPLPPPALTELAPVHEAVRAMGERLAAHAAAERAFSAHAAHALRTPLAGLDAQLAVAQREAPPSLQPRLARLRGATGRLSHVVAALLALFRSGGEIRRAPVDVEALLARVPFEGLTIAIEAAPLRPWGDADLLAAALINLLDNALRHGAQRVRVQVDDTTITLRDDGPGVSADRLVHLRQALAREDAGLAAPDRALAGLGLALADRVARAHGGSLELLAAESGFAVRVVLPRRAGAALDHA